MSLPSKQGDIYFTRSPIWFNQLINRVQAFWSPDSKSPYAHCGIFIGDNCTGFECNWTVKKVSVLNEYKYSKICVLRYKGFDQIKFQEAFNRVLRHEGESYPFYRLPLLVLRLAKFIHWNNVVCSELVVKYLYPLTGDERFYKWFGWSPDDLFDYLENHKDYEKVYEGFI